MAAAPRMRKTFTLYERSFTPCEEHTPNVDLDSGSFCPFGHGERERYGCTCLRVTLRILLADSPTVKACTDCQQGTHDTALAYAVAQAHKRQPITFKLGDLRWWYQRLAERASFGQWGLRLIDWKQACADWQRTAA